MPGVGAGLMRAGGDDVVVVVAGAVDGADGVGEHPCGGVGAGGVRADPVGVEGGDLGGDTDAVHADPGRPGVAGDLGGDVPGEVGGVGGVPGQGEDVVLAVQQPGVAGVGGADGDQQRVGRGLVRDELTQGLRVGAGGQRPAAPVTQVGPGGGQGVGGAQVHGHVGGGELESSKLGHGLVAPGALRREPAQRVVNQLDGGGGHGANGGQRLLHRGQERGWGGDGAARSAVPLLRDAALAQQDPHGPGQDGPAGQAGQQPRRRACFVGRGGARRRPVRCPVWLCRAGGDGCGGAGARGGVAVGGRRFGPGSGVSGLGSRGRGAGGGVAGDRAQLWGGRRGRGFGVAVLGAGDGQAPPREDQVGVLQVPPVALLGVAGGREDSGVAVGVPEAVLRDLAEGVPGPDGVAGTAPPGPRQRRCPGQCARVGRVRVVPANIRHCGPGVPGLRSAISGQRVPSPSSVSAIDHSDSPVVTVCVRALPLVRSCGRLCVATASVLAGRWWRPGGGGGCGPGRRRRHQLGRSRGRGGQGRAGGEQQDCGTDQSLGGRLRQRQRRQVRGRDPAQPGQHLQGDADGQERPAGPGDHGQDAQRQGSVVAGHQRCPDLLQGGNVVGDRVGPDREQHGRQAGQHREDGQGCGEPDQAGADGCCHCSTPPTDRVMRAWPWPVTVIEVIPMIPRNVVS